MKRALIAGVTVCGILFFDLPRINAEVRLPAIWSDHMVLQRDVPVRIGGRAAPGEKVTVRFAGQEGRSKAGQDGTWHVELQPFKTGGPFDLIVQGSNTVKISNVLVGEVWFCSGQSNMALTVQSCANYSAESAQAKYPAIRMFTARHVATERSMVDNAGSWRSCYPDSVGNFSGTAYFFGRTIHKELNVPVGLIHSAWGGTPAQAWTPIASLKADPALRCYLDEWEAALKVYPEKLQKHQAVMAKWQAQAEAAKAEGKEPPRKPRGPLGPGHPGMPGGLYNGMVVPFTGFPVRGAIWYQGEANASQASLYQRLLSRMIMDWRQAWGIPDMPFLIVQLPNIQRGNFDPALPVEEENGWVLMREAQYLTARTVPHAGLAVTIDVGDPKEIHPKNKQDVGHRLALAALAQVYGRNVEFSGPTYAGMVVEGSRIRIKFDHLGGGLVSKTGPKLKSFAVAPSEGDRWEAAEAVIDGDTVVVWHKDVARPARVRYAWKGNPEVGLYNKAGLPAGPFRTDGEY